MAYAMAKVVTVLCMALLVAHVDGARTLKDVDIMTAETHSSEEMFTTEDALPPPVGDEASEFQEIPAPVDSEEYNYNNDTDAAPGSTDEGFLVSDKDGDTTETTSDVFASEGVLVQDQDTESDPEEGTLWNGADGSDSTTQSFADESTTGGFLLDSPPSATESSDSSYVYDATTKDADAVLPAEDGNPDVFAETGNFSFADADTQDVTEPDDHEFEFEEEEPAN